jgi:ribosomal protein S6
MGTDNAVRANQWLNEFAKNGTSQEGEDGIIEKVLEVINDNNGWCVEFGAWDGIYLSNTYNLITDRDYSAVLIEGNPNKFRELLKNFKANRKVIPINAFVGFEEDNCLDSLLRSTGIPIDYDLLSIDIDGNDYHVWEAVKYYRPKVVVIEYNPTIPNSIDFVQPRDMRITQGSSILSLDNLAKQKGYELVAATRLNAVFVDSKYFALFAIQDNSVDAIRSEQPDVTYIFNGYDGTVFIRGSGRLHWHNIPYKQSRLQQVPRWLRQYPGNYGIVKRGVAKVYRYLRSV